MKTVKYKNAWGEDLELLYFENPAVEEGVEGKWHAEVTQELLENLLERAGVYRVGE